MSHPTSKRPNTPTAKSHTESIVITDDQTWIWGLASGVLSQLGRLHVRLPSTVPVELSWSRFRDAPDIIVHLEGVGRSGGAVIEEIMQAAPGTETAGRIVVLTHRPTHEDIVYLSELGIQRIVRLRNREADLLQSKNELLAQLSQGSGVAEPEASWRRLIDAIEKIKKMPPDDERPPHLSPLTELLERLQPTPPTARSLDVAASLESLKGNDDKATELWRQALEKNPNYYRAYLNLAEWHRLRGRHEDALRLLKIRHEANKQNISRLVAIGEILTDLEDLDRAEGYFNSALERDRSCGRALSGLAQVRFRQGRLDDAKRLFAASNVGHMAAAQLNQKGIELVRAKRYAEAIEHYTKAQYVLPHQDKGPLLFFNMGLCYSRWGKPDLAREYVGIALIKDPHYAKAQNLMKVLAKESPHQASWLKSG